MKKILVLLTVMICASFTSIHQDSVFGALNALTVGTWTMKTRRGIICEQWQKKSDRLLSGRSFQVSGTDTSWLENLELSVTGEVITYHSQVNGQNNGKAIPFRLTAAKDGQFIFSNPAHDFPQRIIYQFVTKDSIHAWIEGQVNGKERKSDFYYARKPF
jgi:hypothetical protein